MKIIILIFWVNQSGFADAPPHDVGLLHEETEIEDLHLLLALDLVLAPQIDARVETIAVTADHLPRLHANKKRQIFQYHPGRITAVFFFIYHSLCS